jgi:hypothetical protein
MSEMAEFRQGMGSAANHFRESKGHPSMIPLDEIGFIPEEDWEYIARRTGRSVEQAKRDYRDGLRSHLRNPRPVTIEEVPPEAASLVEAAHEINKSFDITVVPAVLSLRIDVSISGGEDWHGTLKVTAKVFGHGVGSAHAQLSRTNSYIEIHPGVLLAKADLKIGLYGERLCFGVEGRACYWGFGWHCTPINAQGLFCLRS